MRCFVAAFVPAHVRSALVGARPEVDGVRWVAPEKYHVTLRFLGDLDADAARHWVDEAAALATRFPIECTASAVEGFPGPRRARVIAVRIDSGGALEAALGALVRGLPTAEPAGDVGFRAHVTLGRARRRAVRLPPSPALGISFRLQDAALYRSLEGRYERVVM